MTEGERDVADRQTAAQWRRRIDTGLGGVQDHRLADLDRLNRSGAYPVPVGDGRSHWVGCESVHPACRALLERR